jgi:hypothetical protein
MPPKDNTSEIADYVIKKYGKDSGEESNTTKESKRIAKLSDYLIRAYGRNYDKELAAAKEYTDENFPARSWEPAIRDGIPKRFDKRSFAARDLDNSLDAPVPIEENPDLPLGTGGLAYSSRPDVRGINKVEKIEVLPESQLKSKYGISQDDIIQHELGHVAYPTGSTEPNYSKGSTEAGSKDSAIDHLTKPVEAIDVLGRVTRENFKLTGKRFDGESLGKYIEAEDKKPEESRFEGFSIDSKNMLEALRRSKKGEYEGDKDGQFFKDAATIIPSLVKNESFMEAVDRRLS